MNRNSNFYILKVVLFTCICWVASICNSCISDYFAQEEKLPEAGNHRQLFVDDTGIMESENVWRVLHFGSKYSGNPVVIPDQPWEGYLILQPGTVIYDEEEDIFKMWYNTFPTYSKPDVKFYLCYATSRDGITWEKPDLGLVEHKGSRSNNIVLEGVKWNHNVLYKPGESDLHRQYKLAYWGQGALRVAFSQDGIHWNDYENNPVVPRWASNDTFSVMRDPRSGKYWLYHKTARMPVRTISRMVSDDFINWRGSQYVLAPDTFDSPDTQFYGLSAFPFENQYLGFLWVYRTFSQTVDIQMVSSRNGINWERTANRQVLIHRVPTNYRQQREELFDTMMIYPASSPMVKDGHIWLYYSGFNVAHNRPSKEHDGQIGLVRFRQDGFCSMQATSEGSISTTPFKVSGKYLKLNITIGGMNIDAEAFDPAWSGIFTGSPSGRGSIIVEVQDKKGRPIPGYTAHECRALSTSGLEAEVQWGNNVDLSQLFGRTVRLKFILRNASIFSWQISDTISI